MTTYNKHTNWRKAFLLKSEVSQECSLPSLLLKTMLIFLAKAIRQEKDERNTRRKGEFKLSVDNMVMH